MAAKNKETEDSTSSSKYGHLIGADDKSDDLPETVRATDDFPAGNECELQIEHLPDDEMRFGWTDHYEEESRKRTDPDVTSDIIEELLTHGVVREAPGSDWDNRYLVQREIGDYEWTMVVADDGTERDDRWVLITIYSNYHGSVGTTNKYLDRLRERRGE